jgi:hypothetical protein
MSSVPAAFAAARLWVRQASAGPEAVTVGWALWPVHSARELERAASTASCCDPAVDFGEQGYGAEGRADGDPVEYACDHSVLVAID